jgi:LuxR family transcriptional regulator, maltose regulon positive regulatory protein
MSSGGVLLTRLLPPRLPPDHLPRAELASRIAAGARRRVVTVLAGAGYGKSTAILEALAAIPHPAVWLSCDERLGGAPDLLSHLTAGVARVVPGFGSTLSFNGPPDRQVAEFCNEVVATTSDEILLVFDDLQLLDQEATRVVAALVRDLPPWVHLVLAGRAPLGFPLGAVRGGNLLALTEADLVLTEREVDVLWRAAGGGDADSALVHARTEGWITGVLLAAQTGDPGLRRLDGSGQVFDYLAEEVLAAQPAEVQDFVLRTSVLERFSPDLAGRITGVADPRRMCRDVVDRHLFAIRLDEEGVWYRYHHLFQAFLRQRTADEGPAFAHRLHCDAAAAWVAIGHPEEAVDHLLAAGEADAAADLVEPLADAMRVGPQVQVLNRWIDALPDRVFPGRPALTLARAIATFWNGAHEEAFTLLDRAIDDLLGSGEHDRAAAAFFTLIYAQLGSGTRQAHAIDVGYRRLPEVDETAPMLPASMVLMASELGCATRYDEAEEVLGRVLRLRMPAIDPLGQGYLASARALFMDHPRGRSRQALATIEWVIDLFVRHEPFDRLGYLLALRCYRAILLNHLGRYDEALAEVDRLVAHAAPRGQTRGAERVVTKLRAVALAGLERWDELEAVLHEAESFASMRGASYAVRTRAPAALLAAHRGDVGAVAGHARAVMDDVEAFGFSFDLPGWLCDIATAALRVGLADDARRLVTHALHGAERAQSPWARARALLLTHALGEDADGAALTEALEITGRFGMEEIWTRRDRALAGAALARAIEAGTGPEGLAAGLAVRAGGEVLDDCAALLARAGTVARQRLLDAMDAAGVLDADVRARLTAGVAPAILSTAAVDRPPLSIAGLGGFLVRRGAETVPVSAFGRERARALLAALVCAGVPVHREVLLEWLWPDLDPERGLRALHVTLHALRRALEPELGRGSAGRSVIRAEGEAYRLVLRDGDHVDLHDFLRLARTPDGERAATALEAAESLHAGALYPEWPYAEWVAERRREVEDAHAHVLARLADLYLDAGRRREAIVRLERLIAIAPERESAHRALMLAYATGGERPLALRQFHACRAVLRREMGIEPGPETQRLYRSVLDGGPVTAPRVREVALRG